MKCDTMHWWCNAYLAGAVEQLLCELNSCQIPLREVGQKCVLVISAEMTSGGNRRIQAQ